MHQQILTPEAAKQLADKFDLQVRVYCSFNCTRKATGDLEAKYTPDGVNWFTIKVPVCEQCLQGIVEKDLTHYSIGATLQENS